MNKMTYTPEMLEQIKKEIGTELVAELKANRLKISEAKRRKKLEAQSLMVLSQRGQYQPYQPTYKPFDYKYLLWGSAVGLVVMYPLLILVFGGMLALYKMGII